MLSVRPRVAEMSFQLFGRSVHPELFVTHASRAIERAAYTLRIDITSAGHAIALRHEGQVLTEVACSAAQLLPAQRRLMSYRIRGERSDRVECRGGVEYSTCFQLETATPEILLLFQQELKQEGVKKGLIHRFDSSGRANSGAVSYVNAETRNRSVLIQAFHTYPDDCAIVKSQSIFKIP